MTSPEISIVFPTYKRPEETRETVRLLRANVTIPYELFIVDNSPDRDDMALADNEHYIFSGRNAGAEARNVGVECASSPFVLMLDDDSHPFPGALRHAVHKLRRAPSYIGGVIGFIEDRAGHRNASLLPTVFHGCGVIFRRECLTRLGGGYPRDFGYYGEEYWLSMLLCREGYMLMPDPKLRICHRLSNSGRSLNKTFFYLGRNNGPIWQQFVPAPHLEHVLYDTNRRYELIARKEGVADAFAAGCRDAETRSVERTPMTAAQFRRIALLDAFDDLLAQAPPPGPGCVVWIRQVSLPLGRFPEQSRRYGCRYCRLQPRIGRTHLRRAHCHLA